MNIRNVNVSHSHLTTNSIYLLNIHSTNVWNSILDFPFQTNLKVPTINMDEYLTSICIGGLILITFIVSWTIYVTSRSKNETTHLVALQKTQRKEFIAKTQHEGQQIKVESQERIAMAQLQRDETLKTMDVHMHTQNVDLKKTIAHLAADNADKNRIFELQKTEIQLQSVKDQDVRKYDFKRIKLSVQDAAIHKSIEYQERRDDKEMTLHQIEINARKSLGELNATTQRYLADKTVEIQKGNNETEKYRVKLQCGAQIKLGEAAHAIEKETLEVHKALGERQITAVENSHREKIELQKYRENVKLEKVKLAGLTSVLNTAINVGGSVANPTKAFLPLAASVLGGNTATAASSCKNPCTSSIMDKPD